MTDQVNLNLVWAFTGGTTDPGNTKYETGWISEIPTFENFNYVLQALDVNTLALAEKGNWDWQADIAYKAGASVRLASGVIYYAHADSTNQDPAADALGDYWSTTPFYGASFGNRLGKGGLQISGAVPRTNNTWTSNDQTISDNVNSLIGLYSSAAVDNWLIGNISGFPSVVNVGSATSPDGRGISQAEAGTYKLYGEHNKPVVGDVAGAVEEAPDDGKQYARVGTSATTGNWVAVTSTTVSNDVPPTVLGEGAGWYNLADGQFYIDINDGDTSQWVPASPPVIPQVDAVDVDYDDSANGIGSNVQEAIDVLAKRPNDNLIINGGFDIWQRGSQFLAGAAQDKYTADRWTSAWSFVPPSLNISQTANGVGVPAKSTYSYALSYGAAARLTNDIGFFQTQLELLPIRKLISGKKITLSFKASHINTQAMGVYLSYTSANGTVSADIQGQNFTITALTWDEYELTFDMPDIDALSIQGNDRLAIRFVTTAGTARTVEERCGLAEIVWTGDNIALTDVKLEVGSVATPYQPRLIGEELALCERYYCILEGVVFHVGYLPSANSTYRDWKTFPTSMRIVPSTAGILITQLGLYPSNPVFSGATALGVSYIFTGLAAGQVNSFAVYTITADAEL